MREQVIGVIREFETANFRVVADAIEDYDVDLSFDDTGAVRAKLESGEFVCFTARVRVFSNVTGDEIGADYLGGCIYGDITEFEDHRECGRQNRVYEANGDKGRCGSYFAQMIHEACDDARKNLAKMHAVKLRTV